MSDVFVSYKREDQARVVRLVQALERAGLSVWWDCNLGAGESWTVGIQNALDEAKCVIVIWTRASVGPAGGFVRDEARRGMVRGALVPVIFDKVEAPLGFGEIQAIDLSHWKASARDPFLQDLLAAVKAKIEGRVVPPARGPLIRLVRRATYSGIGTAVLFGAVAFGLNAFHAQELVCVVPVLQPGLSDACGGLELGGRPTRRERIQWEARLPGSCADLRKHIETFPGGVYRNAAAGMLAARKVTRTDVWMRAERRLRLFAERDDVPSRNRAAAEGAALARAQADAESLCRGFGAGTLFRYKSAKPDPHVWDCRAAGSGMTCGFDGEAVCELDELKPKEEEACGK